MSVKWLAGIAVALGLVLAGTPLVANAGQTLDKVKQAGMLVCGVSTGVAGFSQPDNQGNYAGLDVDICKAVAAAMFGDATKVKYVPLTAQQRFTALQSGEVDILARNTTWTLQRDTDLGLDFAPVVYYDGQGFMVGKKLGVKSAKELNGATVCVQPGTTTELNLADYFRANQISFKPLVIEKLDELVAAFFSGRCDAFTTDRSGLAAIRVSRAPNPDDYMILPEIISKEPLAPAVRQGDDQFHDVVDWVIYALIQAEEKGITSKNVDDQLKSEDPDVKRMLGVTPGMGKSLGLDEKWAYNEIKMVGNYGEIFDRNVGQGSPLKLDRGKNDLWTKGGLMYAMPIR
ncbi:MAG: amino acid ABC transporter substrate-binding protein [Alphaproteobacteria bacterium]|nr:amino acid ABC transporter substrate-binding protein [Alphaproteobacteria bacterium]